MECSYRFTTNHGPYYFAPIRKQKTLRLCSQTTIILQNRQSYFFNSRAYARVSFQNRNSLYANRSQVDASNSANLFHILSP